MRSALSTRARCTYCPGEHDRGGDVVDGDRERVAVRATVASETVTLIVGLGRALRERALEGAAAGLSVERAADGCRRCRSRCARSGEGVRARIADREAVGVRLPSSTDGRRD